LERVERALREGDVRQEGARVRDRIPGDDVRPLEEEARREDDARRLPEVVRVRLEGHPEERDPTAPQRPEVLLELRDDAPLLQLVHLDDGVQQLEVVARVAGEQLQERDVFWKTAPAE